MFNPDDTASVPTEISFPPLARNRYRVAPVGRSEASERRRTEQDLRNALAHDQLALHYLPTVSLATGVTVGAEALIRWPHRKRGLLAPADFLPTAGRSSLITRIGGWVLRNACNEAAGWQDGGIVSVNIAARQLAEGVLFEQVSEALDLSGLSPERLELDLTEAMLVDIDVDAMLMLSAIRDLGVGIALDDFGTGHASLTVLRRVPLSVLKLDRALVRDLPHFREEADIVRGIVAIGHAMDLTVTAEGIETEQQLAFLTEIGCDLGQGFLFGQPMAAEQFRAQGQVARSQGVERRAMAAA